MKVTLDFTKALPTERQVQYVRLIHSVVHDDMSDSDIDTICKSSVKTCKYLDRYEDEFAVSCRLCSDVFERLFTDDWAMRFLFDMDNLALNYM